MKTGGRLGRFSLALCAGFLFVPEGGFWFGFNFDFTARAGGGAQTELPPLAEGATNPRLESSPEFSEETTELQSSEDSTATQSYLSTGDFFLFLEGNPGRKPVSPLDP